MPLIPKLKGLLYTLLLIFLVGSLNAQLTLPTGKKELSLSYFGQTAIRPGVKVGLFLPMKVWSVEKMKRKGMRTKFRFLYIEPQLGFYTRRHFYTTLLANAEIGIHRQWKEKRGYTAYSIGLGYLTMLEVLSYSVDFSGDISGKEWDRRGFFLPSIGYEIGRKLGSRLTVYSQLTYGMQLSNRFDPSSQIYFELGFKYPLDKGKKT